VTQSRSSAREGKRERPKGGSSTVRRSPKSRSGAGRRGFILTITDGRNAGREYFFESEASLGRTDENNVIIMDPGVSRRHAHISGGEGIFTIEDQGSSNGTRLNGERMTTPEVLRDGDYLQIGETTLLFSVLDVAHEEVTGRTSFAELEEALSDRKYTAEKKYWQVRLRLILRSKGVLAAVLAVLVLGGGYGVYSVLRSGKTGIVIDRSSEVIAYSDADEFFNKSTATAPTTRPTARRCRSSSSTWAAAPRSSTAPGHRQGGRAAGEPQRAEDLGHAADHGALVYGLKVVLPREMLAKGKPNRVVFKSTLNPPARTSGRSAMSRSCRRPYRRRTARRPACSSTWPRRPSRTARSRRSTCTRRWASSRRSGTCWRSCPEARNLRRGRGVHREDRPAPHAEVSGRALRRPPRRALQRTGRVEEGAAAALGFFGKEDFRYREIKRQLDAMEADVRRPSSCCVIPPELEFDDGPR